MERLGALVAGCEARRESIVIEGVHLSPNAVMRLMGRHASVVPFLVYIRYTRFVLVICFSIGGMCIGMCTGETRPTRSCGS